MMDFKGAKPVPVAMRTIFLWLSRRKKSPYGISIFKLIPLMQAGEDLFGEFAAGHMANVKLGAITFCGRVRHSEITGIAVRKEDARTFPAGSNLLRMLTGNRKSKMATSGAGRLKRKTVVAMILRAAGVRRSIRCGRIVISD